MATKHQKTSRPPATNPPAKVDSVTRSVMPTRKAASSPSASVAAAARKRRNTIAIVLVSLAGLIALGAGIAGSRVFSVLSSIGGSGGAGAAWAGITKPREQFPNKNKIHVLVIGKDYNHVNKKGVNFGIQHTREARADTLILVSLDLDTKALSAISVPRDSYIPEQRGKINGTLAHGGVPLTREVVGKLLGVQPDFHVVLKPDSVKDIVNLLGGVEVEAKDRMVYNDSWARLHVDLPKGRYTITGEQAVGFVRYRKPDEWERNPDGTPIYGKDGVMVAKKHVEKSLEDGDDRRMARQQQLIRAMATKAKRPENLWHADKLLDAALGAVETDMTRTQMLALATLFRTAEPEQLQTATIPGSDGFIRSVYGRSWVFRPDEARIKLLVDYLVNGNTEAGYKMTIVRVQNRTPVRGAATRIVNLLKEKGFERAEIAASAKESDSDAATTRIVYGKASMEARARHVVEVIGGSSVVLVKDANLLESAHSIQQSGSTDDDVASQTTDIAVLLGRDVAGNSVADAR